MVGRSQQQRELDANVPITLWWWLAIEEVYSLPLSVTTWQRLRVASKLSSPFHPPMSPHPRGEGAWLLAGTSLLPQATAVAGAAPLERGGSCWVVGLAGLDVHIALRGYKEAELKLPVGWSSFR